MITQETGMLIGWLETFSTHWWTFGDHSEQVSPAQGGTGNGIGHRVGRAGKR